MLIPTIICVTVQRIAVASEVDSWPMYHLELTITWIMCEAYIQEILPYCSFSILITKNLIAMSNKNTVYFNDLNLFSEIWFCSTNDHIKQRPLYVDRNKNTPMYKPFLNVLHFKFHELYILKCFNCLFFYFVIFSAKWQ
jgi:hypothetical protein